MEPQPPHQESQSELEALRARVAQLESLEREHGRTEAALRESEQLYRRLVETSPDGILLADVGGQILMANRQSAHLHGCSEPAELVGLGIMDIVLEEDRPQAAEDMKRILESGELRDRKYVLLRRDGSSFVAEVTGSVIRDATGEPKYIICNGRDITAQLRMNRELVEAQKLESIGRLAGGIAHDFNNLLAVILGNASLQLRNRALPPKTTECLKDIVEAAERASSLTTQLLAYARGGLRRAVTSDLNKLAQAACEIIKPTLPRQVQLRVELKEGIPPIIVDRSQIQQVVINLCMNAAQASPAPGEVLVTSDVDVLDEDRAASLQVRPGAYVLLRVQDRGPGMDSSTLERIFEPFFTTKSESRGMGLPASLGIVQAHNGRLLITSRPGQGTTASVWLPAAAANTADQRPCEARPDGAAVVINAPHGHETILVVDPDPAVSHTAAQILASLGYCVVTRTDADQAMAFLETNLEDIDLALLNFNLPTKSGERLVDCVLDQIKTLPILLTSGYDQAAASALVRSGATGFVQKPFSVMSLAQAVRGVLDDPKRAKRSDAEQA